MRNNKGQFVKGHQFTDEMLTKMSNAKIGKASWNNGKKASEETRMKLSKARVGIAPWNKGIHTGQTPWNKGKSSNREVTLIGHNKECPVCGTEFYVAPYQIKKGWGKFCSQQCSAKGRISGGLFQKGHAIVGGAHSMPHTEEGKRNISKAKRESNKDKMPNILSKVKRGLSRKVNQSFQWKDWRKSVFERDNYTCMECGVRGGYLEPHHIIPLRKDRSLLFTIRNGITLCRPCHKKTMGKEHLFEEKYSSLVSSLEQTYGSILLDTFGRKCELGNKR